MPQDNRFIGRRFAGLTDAEKQNMDTLMADFQQKQQALHDARLALQNFVSQMRDKYNLLPSTPFATGDLAALRAEEQAYADKRQADIDLAMSRATDAEKAKYNAWVAAGKPVRNVGRSPRLG